MPLFEKVLDMYISLFGGDHPKVLMVQHSIAMALYELGNLTLAHDLHQHVLSIRRRVLGDTHIITLESYTSVGEALLHMSHIYPQNNAAAASKRKPKVKVTKAVGPTLAEHLGAILGIDDSRLKNKWPPEVSALSDTMRIYFMYICYSYPCIYIALYCLNSN